MKKKKKRKELPVEANLNITAMASIFVVILVFLLKTITTDVASIAPTQNLVLPEVKTAQAVEDALKIEISAESILVDQKQVLKLEDFRFDSKELSSGGGLTQVTAAIREEKKNHLSEKPESERKVVIIADQKTPYETLKRVISSTSSEGLMNLSLMVVKVE